MGTEINQQYTLLLLLILSDLQKSIGKIPRLFLSSRCNDSILTEGVGFNPNDFLIVFDKIKLKEDYVLDYAFFSGDLGGQPMVYTRHIHDRRLSYNEYAEKYKGTDKEAYLDDITIDNTPESFLQLAMFNKVVHQFYLCWHALYNDYKFIFNYHSALKTLQGEISPDNPIHCLQEYIEKLKNISFTPEVELNNSDEETQDEPPQSWLSKIRYMLPSGFMGKSANQSTPRWTAKVRYIQFSSWEGFIREEATIYLPKIKIDTTKTTIISYRCNICF